MAVSFIPTPSWLDTLFERTFFMDCTNQKGCKVKNILCLECCNSYCSKCVDQHNHLHRRHIKVLRYTHQYIVRSPDMRKFMDCSKIQSHLVNGVKAFFLKARETANSYRGSHNICPTCQCFVQPSEYVYCSIMCKVYHFLESPTGLQGLLRGEHKNPPNEDHEGETLEYSSRRTQASAVLASMRGLEAGESSEARDGSSTGSQVGGETHRRVGASRRKSSCPTRAPFS